MMRACSVLLMLAAVACTPPALPPETYPPLPAPPVFAWDSPTLRVHVERDLPHTFTLRIRSADGSPYPYTSFRWAGTTRSPRG